MVKKIMFLAVIFVLAVVSVYYANAYTSAMVENPVSLSVTNPHGMLSLIPEEDLNIKQGESQKALTVTNNMGVYISFRLEHSHQALSLENGSGILSPGESRAIMLTVSNLCSIGSISLEIELCADFDGGRAQVRTTVPLQVLPAPPPAPENQPEQELEEDDTAVDTEDQTEESVLIEEDSEEDPLNEPDHDTQEEDLENPDDPGSPQG